MIMTKTFAVVRTQFEAFHAWVDAPAQRFYLAFNHRHIFHVEVKLQVFHDDRDVEFHDLLDYTKKFLPSGDIGGKSCEQICAELMQVISRRYPKRDVTVSVFEDGENGATMEGSYSE